MTNLEKAILDEDSINNYFEQTDNAQFKKDVKELRGAYIDKEAIQTAIEILKSFVDEKRIIQEG